MFDINRKASFCHSDYATVQNNLLDIEKLVRWSSSPFDTNAVVGNVAICWPLHRCPCVNYEHRFCKSNKAEKWNCTLNQPDVFVFLYLSGSDTGSSPLLNDRGLWNKSMFSTCEVTVKLTDSYLTVKGIWAESCRALGKKPRRVIWTSGRLMPRFIRITSRLLSRCFPLTHILLLDLHELMSLILNNKKLNLSMSAAGFFYEIDVCFWLLSWEVKDEKKTFILDQN